jgi:excisionase family DNA binding protein
MAQQLASSRQSDLMTRHEAAGYLGVTPHTLSVWACTRRYDLPFVKIGRKVMYRKAHLDSFIEARTLTQLVPAF